jgi:hypothetical protein
MNSSSRSKALRAAMGFSFHSPGCVKRAKNVGTKAMHQRVASAAKAKEKPAKVKQ